MGWPQWFDLPEHITAGEHLKGRDHAFFSGVGVEPGFLCVALVLLELTL